jgi:progressive ankylosis protein
VKPQKPESEPISLGTLWREFLPLSLSDVTMACGDPMMTTTLAYLPDAQNNLAAVGIAKSLAIFFESPIIMILHAANALAGSQDSRKALWRFTLFVGGGLTFLLSLLGLPIIFNFVGVSLLGIPSAMLATVSQVLLLVGGWPFAIAWRRYFQGLLIYHGQSGALAKASICRLFTLALVLIIGFSLQISGGVVAGLGLMGGVIVEAIVVTIFAYRSGAILPPEIEQPNLPRNLTQVWKFYLPLANSMMVVWGGRAILISILARAEDATIAIAAWTAAWGLVLVIANSTRMVQQMVIKYRHQVSDRQLLSFAVSVGAACSTVLLLMSLTPIGDHIVQSFIGNDLTLAKSIKPILLICTIVPLFVALQNATQGFLVSENRTGHVNLSTWLGTGTLLIIVTLAINNGMNGATSAAIAMITSMLVEISCLLWKRVAKSQ